MIIVTLEDEYGMVNVVVWHDPAERQRRVLVNSQLLRVDGHLESKDGVRHLIAGRLSDLTPLLVGLDVCGVGIFSDAGGWIGRREQAASKGRQKAESSRPR